MISPVLCTWVVSVDGLVLNYIEPLSDTALDLRLYVLTPAASVAFDQCFQL